MINVVRIEHNETGFGIYNSLDDNGIRHFKKIGRLTYKSITYKANKFPNPLNDIKILRLPEKSELCAFKSREDLLNLFSKYELRKLNKVGFEIFELSLKRAIIGNDQILFTNNDIISKQNVTKHIINQIKKL